MQLRLPVPIGPRTALTLLRPIVQVEPAELAKAVLRVTHHAKSLTQPLSLALIELKPFSLQEDRPRLLGVCSLTSPVFKLPEFPVRVLHRFVSCGRGARKRPVVFTPNRVWTGLGVRQ